MIDSAEAYKLCNRFSKADATYLRYNVTESPAMRHLLDEHFENPIINLRIANSLISKTFPQEYLIEK